MPWANAQTRAVVEMLFAMGEVYNEPVSEARAEMCCRALEDLPFESVEAVARRHLQASPFFPKPADLRRVIEAPVDNRQIDDEAEMAWTWLLREVRRVGYIGTPTWPDDITQRGAEGLFGSWRALCERLPATGPELLGFRKQFVLLYGGTKRQALKGELQPGHAEDKALL